MNTPASGYLFVYHIEIGLLFAGLAAVGPLVRHKSSSPAEAGQSFGLAEFTGQ